MLNEHPKRASNNVDLVAYPRRGPGPSRLPLLQMDSNMIIL